MKGRDVRLESIFFFFSLHVRKVGLARAALDGALDGSERLVVPVALNGLGGAVNNVLYEELFDMGEKEM